LVESGTNPIFRREATEGDYPAGVSVLWARPGSRRATAQAFERSLGANHDEPIHGNHAHPARRAFAPKCGGALYAAVVRKAAGESLITKVSATLIGHFF
jgi:hypothetical protein